MRGRRRFVLSAGDPRRCNIARVDGAMPVAQAGDTARRNGSSDRRTHPRRQPARATARTSSSACRAKAFSARSRRSARSRTGSGLIVCRQEGGAANMAEAYGKLTGRPGICFVTRGPGRRQRDDRAPHCAAGFHADAPPDRAGRPRRAWPRGVSGGRLPPHARRGDEMGRSGRRPGAHPGIRRARLCDRDGGAARAGRAGLSRGRADGRLRRRTTCRRCPVVEPAPARGADGGACRAPRRGGAAACDRRRQRLVAKRRAPISSASPKPSSFRSPPPSAARTAWTTPMRSMSASSARPSRRILASASATPILSSRSARGSMR